MSRIAADFSRSRITNLVQQLYASTNLRADVIQPKRPALIGGDIGGTNVRLAAVELQTGNLLTDPLVLKMDSVSDYPALVREIKSLQDSIRRALPSEVTVLGAATGFPAPVDEKGKLNFKPANINFSLSPDFGKDTEQLVINDANGIAKALAYFDPQGSRTNKFVVILPGTGLGTAGIDGDRLILPFAFEGGHKKIFDPLDLAGPQCGCGARGCAELWISGPGLMRTARKLGLESDFNKPEDITSAFERGTAESDRIMNEVVQNTIRFLSTLDADIFPAAYFFGEGFLRGRNVDAFLCKLSLQITGTVLDPGFLSFGRGPLVSKNLYPIRLENPGIKGAAIIAAENLVAIWP